jgi:hypothetical protein
VSILKDNYAALSRGGDALTLNDLKLDGDDQSFAPEVRKAAQVAENHYSNLIAIGAAICFQGLA